MKTLLFFLKFKIWFFVESLYNNDQPLSLLAMPYSLMEYIRCVFLQNFHYLPWDHSNQFQVLVRKDKTFEIGKTGNMPIAHKLLSSEQTVFTAPICFLSSVILWTLNMPRPLALNINAHIRTWKIIYLFNFFH